MQHWTTGDVLVDLPEDYHAVLGKVLVIPHHVAVWQWAPKPKPPKPAPAVEPTRVWSYEEMETAKLRELAQDHGIKGWKRASREKLIERLSALE